MILELTVRELGEALEKIEEKYGLDILIKSQLSGGWMTITGQVTVEKSPQVVSSECGSNKDNIIDIKIKNIGNEDGAIIKITGDKNKKFKIDISSTRYKELHPNNLTINQIKINKNESKLRIDENIIFTIKTSVDEIEKILKSEG